MARSSPAACSSSRNSRRVRKGRRVGRGALAAVACACIAAAAHIVHAEDSDAVLRVCADPNNMPLSNQRAEGYENKIAEEMARDFNRRVEYTFFPQGMGFVRNTLKSKDPRTD